MWKEAGEICLIDKQGCVREEKRQMVWLLAVAEVARWGDHKEATIARGHSKPKPVELSCLQKWQMVGDASCYLDHPPNYSGSDRKIVAVGSYRGDH